jgi:L-lysine exporter family protein LysE/ArgO
MPLDSITLLRNIALGLSLAAPPGPSGVTVIQNGLRHGFRRAFLTGIGVTLADATCLLAVFFGLAGFIEIPMVRAAVFALGALVLGYFGLRSLQGAAARLDLESAVTATARSPLLVGYAVNISNPIALVWWAGVFGSLLGELSGEMTKLQALLSSSAILAGILTWHFTTSCLSHWGQRFINRKTARYVSLIAGAALLLFGLRFAYLAALAMMGEPGV